MTLTKIVNGIEVEMSLEEAEATRLAWAEAEEEALKNRYKELRKQAYLEVFGPLEDELDYIYHHGLDAWKEQIDTIKQQYPKPEEE